MFTGLSLAPLAVFLRMAAAGGYASDADWRPAFFAGAALCVCFAAVAYIRRRPVPDVFAASALMLLSGAAAFLAGAWPLLEVYGRLKGSVFLFYYAALRAGVLLRPALFGGWMKDDYGRLPLAAAAASAAALAWSFIRPGMIGGVAVPFLLVTLALRAAAWRLGRGGAA